MASAFWLVWAGRGLQGPFEELAADYRGRIEGYLPMVERAVKAKAAAQSPDRLEREAEAIERALPRDCFRVALDRTGEAWSSEELARRLERWRREWPHPVAFLIGSDLGLERRLIASCRVRWSLGPLTLPHALARVVVYEQLFRALSIGAGIHYHRPSFSAADA